MLSTNRIKLLKPIKSMYTKICKLAVSLKPLSIYSQKVEPISTVKLQMFFTSFILFNFWGYKTETVNFQEEV